MKSTLPLNLPENPGHEDARLHDVHEIARYLNITPRRVQMLVKRGVLPRAGMRGKYDLVACIHAYIEHLKKMLYHYAGFYSGKLSGKRDPRPLTGADRETPIHELPDLFELAPAGIAERPE